ncbi:hypothetical protein FWK35_00013931 [Aphis craccivora]|uniref:Uncharacterized protein n=1 Tax=Aphis craccivora TaxID=307492 RepID=A0A6G0YBJ3_APHCR|nr:hypothetical protein FWK35_00013931 [Aphis craccivora]
MRHNFIDTIKKISQKYRKFQWSINNSNFSRFFLKTYFRFLSPKKMLDDQKNLKI